ncbi:MAG: hypothetical protein FWG20_01855 [Candidatus Cloacimonetes bacterium]|nr:hypothetical protein [Candidatus Cloacimonadota bacterium]
MCKKEDVYCKFVAMCPKVREFCESQTDNICFWGSNPIIKSASGKVPHYDIECVSHNGGEAYYGRRRGKRVVTEKNKIWGAYMSHLNELWKSLPEDVKQNFAEYADIAFQNSCDDKCKASGRTFFFKVLGQQKDYFVSLEEISEFFGNTLNDWIARGFLIDFELTNIFFAQIIPE